MAVCSIEDREVRGSNPLDQGVNWYPEFDLPVVQVVCWLRIKLGVK